VYLASELSNENSKIYTNEKASYLTNKPVPSGGPRPSFGLFSTFYWAVQHVLWAVPDKGSAGSVAFQECGALQV